MSKRKRVVLSLGDKMKIIEGIKNGESGSKLAQIYGVGVSTISDIKKNSASLMKFTYALEKEDGSSQRKVMKKPKNEILENAVFTWFLQKRACGQRISGPLLCEKALDFNKCLVVILLSKRAVDEYDLDFLNADETGLNWKALPSRSLSSRRENAAPGHKVSKDRVTVMVCVNARGTHRLPLLLIVEVWNAVESQTLKRAWNKLLKLSPSANPVMNPQEDYFEEITEAVKILSIGEVCDEENIKEWLDCDKIVDDLNGCENAEKEETETKDERQGPSHAEAFEALEIAFKWFERQEESDSLQLLQLMRIRDLAALKR
ncbi:jerky protein [Danaus plexippus plexippus]|uniref:Jerky protein n=1 Tax=Danaus plexippus plexippus TaxID=278856 RepID=A0A212FLE6_DANPL|nr:jerky protein [Danaus plexippus plexippus]